MEKCSSEKFRLYINWKQILFKYFCPVELLKFFFSFSGIKRIKYVKLYLLFNIFYIKHILLYTLCSKGKNLNFQIFIIIDLNLLYWEINDFTHTPNTHCLGQNYRFVFNAKNH